MPWGSGFLVSLKPKTLDRSTFLTRTTLMRGLSTFVLDECDRRDAWLFFSRPGGSWDLMRQHKVL